MMPWKRSPEESNAVVPEPVSNCQDPNRPITVTSSVVVVDVVVVVAAIVEVVTLVVAVISDFDVVVAAVAANVDDVVVRAAVDAAVMVVVVLGGVVHDGLALDNVSMAAASSATLYNRTSSSSPSNARLTAPSRRPM